MRRAWPLLFAVVLLQALAGWLAAVLHWPLWRMDPAMGALVFVALRLPAGPGAVAIASMGFLTDLGCGAPLGLHMLAYTLLALAVRPLARTLGVTQTLFAVPLGALVSLGLKATVALLLGLFDAGGAARLAPVGVQLGTALLDGVLALPVWLLLERLWRSPSTEGELAWRRL